jgi:fermentation-respiration switch protein FrsA (DUF1100 family)
MGNVKERRRINVWRILALSLGAVAIGLLLGYAMIDRFIFYPEKLSGDFTYQLKPGDRELFIETRDGEQINGILFKARRGRGVILYFHGNAGSLSSWQYVAEDIVPKGYDLLVIDYRGYGKSTGKITEDGFYLDAEACYAELLSLGYEPERIVLYGRSLGTGVAIELATRKTASALVLESPFTSLPELASHLLPIPIPTFYIPYRFDSLAKAPGIKIPSLVMHGSDDELIPTEMGRKVYDALGGPRRFVSIRGGGHNNLSDFREYHEALEKFLEEAAAGR